MTQTSEGYLLLGNPGPSEQVMRALELKGDLPQHLDPRYQLGIQALDLESVPYRYLRRAIRYQVFQAAAAVAAQHGQFCFFPPPNFNNTRPTLVWIRHFTFIAAAGAGYEVGFGLTAAGGGGTGAPLQGVAQDDRAYPGIATSGSTLQVGNAVASGLQPGSRFMRVPAGESLEVEVDYVLTSRSINGIFLTGVFIEVSDLNVAASLTVEFEERPLLTSEL